MAYRVPGLRAPATLLLVILSALLTIPSAVAGAAFYVDAGGGVVRDSGDAGYGLNLGLWTTFTTNEPPLNFQLGVQDRYASTSASGSASSELNVPYVVARLQASMIYLGFGYSPYVMASSGSSSSATSLSRVQGVSSMMGQLGFLAPITPKFSWGAEGTYQTLSGGSFSGSSANYGIAALMRFYFDLGDGSGSSSEFHGWRYPFGREF